MLVVDREFRKAFEEAFEVGDELFETKFNAIDGVGANVGQNLRFTRVPRADLTGPGEWANHIPTRATGPNAESCSSCHNQPFDDRAGSAALDVRRDPLHTANVGSFIRRNTPHVFAIGAVQRLAQEMTDELMDIRDLAPIGKRHWVWFDHRDACGRFIAEPGPPARALPSAASWWTRQG